MAQLSDIGAHGMGGSNHRSVADMVAFATNARTG
jgi:hypothetical protein